MTVKKMTFPCYRAIALSGLVVLAACTSTGEIDNIALRKASWTSFLSGEDIAQSCVAGGGDHYRLTYNANRAKQVRIYDLTQAQGQWTLRSRVLERAIAVKPMPVDELMSVLDPVDREKPLTEPQAEAIRQGLEQAQAEGGVPVGDRLFSPGFFWLAASCENGEFRFDAWDYPDRGFAATAGFAPVLFRLDPNDSAVRQPEGDVRITPTSYGPMKRERDAFEHYELVVKEDRVTFGRTYPQSRK